MTATVTATVAIATDCGVHDYYTVSCNCAFNAFANCWHCCCAIFSSFLCVLHVLKNVQKSVRSEISKETKPK